MRILWYISIRTSHSSCSRAMRGCGQWFPYWIGRSRNGRESYSYFDLPFTKFVHFSPLVPALLKVPPFPSLSSTLFYKYVQPPEYFGKLKRPSRAGPRTVRRPQGRPSLLQRALGRSFASAVLRFGSSALGGLGGGQLHSRGSEATPGDRGLSWLSGRLMTSQRHD